jgi:hypothetical protein
VGALRRAGVLWVVCNHTDERTLVPTTRETDLTVVGEP